MCLNDISESVHSVCLLDAAHFSVGIVAVSLLSFQNAGACYRNQLSVTLNIVGLYDCYNIL